MDETNVSGPRAVAASPALAGQVRNPLVRRIAGHKRYWLYSRLLATAGALLVALAAWMPWVSVRVFDVTRAEYLTAPLQLDPGDLDPVYYGGIVWAALTVTGLLIVPFLWQRPAPGSRAPLAPFVYTLWTIALLVLGGMASGAILQPSLAVGLVPELSPRLIGIDRQSYLLGTWLGGAGAVLAVLATFALIISLLRVPLDARPRAASVRARRSAAGALVFGALLWGAGTLVLPWATVSCTAVPLFFGQCAGLPFSGALSAAIRVDVPGLDPLAAIYGVNLLLSGAALLVLIALFRGVRSRFFAFWTTVWLAVASGCALLAFDGARLVTSQPAQLGLQPGTWNADMGIFVTLLALALGWAGAVVLWLGGQRSHPA